MRRADTRRRVATVTAMLLAAAAAASAVAPAAATEPARVALMPVQDRSGDPEALAALESALRVELGRFHPLVEPETIRNAMRTTRLRDPGAGPPAALDALAERVGADWCFLATLHAAGRGHVPQASVSARIVERGRRHLAWAGFESVSGLDAMGALGIGRVERLEELLPVLARRLVEDFAGDPRRRRRAPTARGGFLREPVTNVGTVAVIPFDAVEARDPTIAAETVTNLALAVLHRRGVTIADPAAVEELLRRRGVRSRGGLDALSRGALRAALGPELFLTGTVERYDLEGSPLSPEPVVALSARLLGAADGRILWLDGIEWTGRDTTGPFGLGRVHATGVMAERMITALVGAWLAAPPKENRR